jgi:hypothetical protein
MRRLVLPMLLVVAACFSLDFLISAYSKYHGSKPESFGMFWDRQGWLYTHLAGGVLTLILGPLQLLQERYDAVRSVHRWSGRLYVLGILVGSVGAIGLISTSPAPPEIRIALAATMLAWLATAAIALQAIFRKRPLLHRAWMIRNYLVTLAPITFRLLLRLAIALGFTPSPGTIATLLWAGWAVPLLAFEVLSRMPKIQLTDAGKSFAQADHGDQ